MTKFITTCILIISICITTIVVFTTPSELVMLKERRKISSFPHLKKIRFRYALEFLEGLSLFFIDRFPFRENLIEKTAEFGAIVHYNIDPGKCYLGESSWLFLGNDYGYCVDKLTGRRILSKSKIEKEVRRYKSMKDAVEERGSQFFIFIGPNKSSIYPEYLPPVIIPATQRYIEPLVTALQQSGVNVYDPTVHLNKMKSSDLLYYRTGTHWNNRGATIAFQEFLKEENFPPLPPFSFEDLGLRRGGLVGMGGYKEFTLSPKDNFKTHWSTPQDIQVENNVFRNSHAIVNKKVWVFGDSFSTALKQILPVEFSEVHFFSLTRSGFKEMMSSQQSSPDIVFWVTVERNFGH